MTEMETPNTPEVRNINDQVTFRLTDRGREVFEASSIAADDALDELHAAVGHDYVGSLESSGAFKAWRDHMVAEDGSVTMPLWRMAQIFGPHLEMGEDPVIDGNSFTFQQ